VKNVSTFTRWVFGAIIVVGLTLPWFTAVWVKSILDSEGTPTWSWDVILSPGLLLFEVPATLIAAASFFALAYFARNILSAPDLTSKEYWERFVVVMFGLAVGAFSAVQNFYDLFYNPYEPLLSLFACPVIAVLSGLFIILGLTAGYLLILMMRVIIGGLGKHRQGTPAAHG
jgi:hypothetical protein